MSATSTYSPEIALRPGFEIHPPQWLDELFRGTALQYVQTSERLQAGVQEKDNFTFVRVRLPGARTLGPADFERCTSEIYLTIERELRAKDAKHPVRLWNYLPDIHAPSSDGTDRYMAFNAGRFHAYSQWLGGAGTFDRTVPTASAVGHDGM